MALNLYHDSKPARRLRREAPPVQIAAEGAGWRVEFWRDTRDYAAYAGVEYIGSRSTLIEAEHLARKEAGT